MVYHAVWAVCFFVYYHCHLPIAHCPLPVVYLHSVSSACCLLLDILLVHLVLNIFGSESIL